MLNWACVFMHFVLFFFCFVFSLFLLGERLCIKKKNLHVFHRKGELDLNPSKGDPNDTKNRGRDNLEVKCGSSFSDSLDAASLLSVAQLSFKFG